MDIDKRKLRHAIFGGFFCRVALPNKNALDVAYSQFVLESILDERESKNMMNAKTTKTEMMVQMDARDLCKRAMLIAIQKLARPG